jgi:hypothetical protein
VGIIQRTRTMFRLLKAARKVVVNPPRLLNSEAEVIVHAYADAMVAKAATPSILMDASELPYPKARIKEALIHAMRVTEDAKSRELLKDGYMYLSEWQEGVGQGPGPFDFTQADIDDHLRTARRIASEGPAFMKLNAQSIVEGKALLEELKALGL